MTDYILTFGGGEVWIFVPRHVWILGGILALHAGLAFGWALVDMVKRRWG